MTGEETKHWTFHHIGAVVTDMEKAVAYYQSLGFIEILPAKSGANAGQADRSTWVEMTAYGETVIEDGKVLVPQKSAGKPVPNTWCRLGSLTLELIQPVEDGWRNVNKDFLEDVGEGINHIAYMVTSEHFDDEVAKMKGRGIDIIMSGKQSNGGGFAYFDTRKVGGFIIALMRAKD